MILYADTSAVVKAVREEPGTSQVREWFAAAGQVATSVITYPEACSAIGRMHRLGARAPDALQVMTARLDLQWSEFLVLAVAAEEAGRLALRHGLRGMDAVQLSAALALRDAVLREAPGADIVFSAFDGRLLEAAEHEGFATLGGRLD